MKNYILRFTKRSKRKISAKECFFSGIKALITITAISAIGYYSNHELVIAPFATSCLMVFSRPEDDVAQPMNIIGGYFIASVIGVIASYIFPHAWWVLGISLATTIYAMYYFRVTHPPAGAVPFIIYLHHTDAYLRTTADIKFILYPTLAGRICIVLLATILNLLPFAKREYPRKKDPQNI